MVSAATGQAVEYQVVTGINATVFTERLNDAAGEGWRFLALMPQGLGDMVTALVEREVPA